MKGSKAAAISGLMLLALAGHGSSQNSIDEPASVERGRLVFERNCRACHTVSAAAPRKLGPTLAGVFGRVSGTLGRFPYSSAMQAKAIRWDEEALGNFVRNPSQFVPGTRMPFAGLSNDLERASLLLYLKRATLPD